MEDSVLSFLRAEWKVSDTSSTQCWASTLVQFHLCFCEFSWQDCGTVSTIVLKFCLYFSITFWNCSMFFLFYFFLSWIGRQLYPTFWLWIWCLTPLSTIVQLYRGGQFYCWRKPDYTEKSHWQSLSRNVIPSLEYTSSEWCSNSQC
jgi:hypothetical protein